MPRGDHRGPNAEGPRTGRGMGFCHGAGSAGLAKQGATIQEGEESQGGGRRHGRGRHGRRRRHLFHATGLTDWQQQADRLADELDQVRQQIQEFQNRQESTGEQAV